MWFTEQDNGVIGRDHAHRHDHRVPVRHHADSEPTGITGRRPTATSGSPSTAPTRSAGSRPTGTITEYPVPAAHAHPWTRGPDGNLWFASGPATATVGTDHSATGAITEFPSRGASAALRIAPGPDGNLWFTEFPAARPR